MKYLSDYMKDNQTKAFDQFNAFFAFSDKQFNESKKTGFKYTFMGSGMFVPAYDADNLYHALNATYKNAIQQDIKENGVKKIIHRELANHECQLACNYDCVVDILDDYGITSEQIENEWNEYFQMCIDNDYF